MKVPIKPDIPDDGRGFAVRRVGRKSKIRADLNHMRKFVPCILHEVLPFARFSGLSRSITGNSISSTSRSVEFGFSLQLQSQVTVINKAPPTLISIMSLSVLRSYAPPGICSEGVAQNRRRIVTSGGASPCPCDPQTEDTEPCPCSHCVGLSWISPEVCSEG